MTETEILNELERRLKEDYARCWAVWGDTEEQAALERVMGWIEELRAKLPPEESGTVWAEPRIIMDPI